MTTNKADYQRQYYQANKEKLREKQRQRYQANREKIADYQRQYRKANREKLDDYNRQRYQDRKARGAALLDVFLSSRPKSKPQVQPTPKAPPPTQSAVPVDSFICAHCGKPTIRRYPSQEFCLHPRCQRAERQKYGALPKIRICDVAKKGA